MEIDAALTADGVLVALHDRDLAQLLGRPTARVCPPALNSHSSATTFPLLCAHTPAH